MATWKGEAWLGTASGRQTVTVQSSTFTGAREQIQQIYGTSDVHNLREVGRSESSSSDTDFGGIALLCGGLFVLWLIIEYWMFVIPLTIIGAILYYFGTKDQ